MKLERLMKVWVTREGATFADVREMVLGTAFDGEGHVYTTEPEAWAHVAAIKASKVAEAQKELVRAERAHDDAVRRSREPQVSPQGE